MPAQTLMFRSLPVTWRLQIKKLDQKWARWSKVMDIRVKLTEEFVEILSYFLTFHGTFLADQQGQNMVYRIGWEREFCGDYKPSNQISEKPFYQKLWTKTSIKSHFCLKDASFLSTFSRLLIRPFRWENTTSVYPVNWTFD